VAPRDPEELEAAGAPARAEIAADTTVGPVHLTVSDLERSLGYYRDSVGLMLVDEGAGRAELGAGENVLLVLVEDPDARPAPRHTGLYHFALLVPRRVDLARWLAHAAHDRVALTGLSDHFVSEALYLSDPDGHGIEIYWDRPREVWEGQVDARMTTLPLDVEDLIGELGDPRSDRASELPARTVMGHVHFKVAAVPDTIAFYHDLLGFAVMAQLGPQAVFLSAGGYHHHIGANTWESAGASPPPPGSAALRLATIVFQSPAARDALLARVEAGGHDIAPTDLGPTIQDPSGNVLALACRAP